MTISQLDSPLVAENGSAGPLPGHLPFDIQDMAVDMPLDGHSMRRLDATPDEMFDRVKFGIVALTRGGAVVAYNRAEAALSGLDPKRVIGRRFFTSVAPCTNNFLVAHRFQSEAVLDEFVDYLFTFKMAPTPVRLRLLKHPDAERMYLFVERRRPADD
jgi:photoactive yellow protein